MRLNSFDVWAHLAPMFHLVDVFAVYSITLVGGRHVIQHAFNSLDALLLMEQEQVTVVNMASTMVAMLVNNPVVETLDLRSLRVLSCGGSPQSPAVLARAISVFGCEFFVSYGMTECCGKISMSILPEDLQDVDPMQQFDWICTSGRPFSLVDVRVVDESGKDVPKDGQTVGEVWVKGATVFSGYQGLEEANQEAFSEDGWFKTGDLAVARPDSYITVVDRKKDMLLVGGENVYTTEVEAVLNAHPAVHHAAVFGLPNQLMGDLVAAAVTLVPGLTSLPDKQTIVNWCRDHLAEYKVPVEIFYLEKLPTTSTGKPLKNELRRIFSSPSRHQMQEITFIEKITVSPIDIAAEACGGNISTFSVSEIMDHTNRTEEMSLQGLTYVLIAENEKELPALLEIAHENFTHCALVLTMSSEDLSSQNVHKAIENMSSDLDAVVIACIPQSRECANFEAMVKAAVAVVQERMPPIAAIVYVDEETQKEAIPKEIDVDINQAAQAALRSFLKDEETLNLVALGHLPLMQAGLTSTSAVQYVSALENSLGLQLPGTLIFDYPTIPDIVSFVNEEKKRVSPGQEPPKTPAVAIEGLPSMQMPTPTPSPAIRFDISRNVLSTILNSIREYSREKDIDADTPLMAAGLTSTSAVQLVSELESIFKTQLPGTLAFDYPTASSMAQFIEDNLSTEKMSSIAPVAARALTFSPLEGLVDLAAVTAIDHRVPGWSLQPLVVEGNDRITLVPLERWDTDVPPPENPMEFNMQFGSFLEDIELFDASAFHITPAEASIMDPQQRIALMSFSKAVAEHRQFNNGQISRHMGIFVGISQLDYASIVMKCGASSNTYYATGSHLSVAAGRLSYCFGLSGPAAAIDTACSSSLVTAHMAIQALKNRDCEAAGSLGVNLALVHSWTRACLRSGMLADDGRCKTFDASADGYVRAEAVSSTIIQMLRSGADQQSSNILGIVAGTAVNEDGRSSALTAPNGPAQQELIKSALLKAGVSGWECSYLQMHGTGTSLGDPIELGAALPVFDRHASGEGSALRGPLHLTSAKAILGHAEPAAGGVGVTHLIYNLRTMSTDHLVHLRSLNPYIANTLDTFVSITKSNQPVIPRQMVPQPIGTAASELIGGVSSFAFQGTNAHATIVQKSDMTSDQLPRVWNDSTVTGSNFIAQRFWVLPPAHPLASVAQVMRTAGSSSSITIEGYLERPRLSCLMGNKVQEVSILAQFVPLEAAIAAITALHASDFDTSSSKFAAITDGIFERQVKLGHISRQPNALLSCSIQIPYDDVQVDLKGAESNPTLFSGHLGHILGVPHGAETQLRSPSVVLGELCRHDPFDGLTKPAFTASLPDYGQKIIDGFVCPPQIMDAAFHIQAAQDSWVPQLVAAMGSFTCWKAQSGGHSSKDTSGCIGTSLTSQHIHKISCSNNWGWFGFEDVSAKGIDDVGDRVTLHVGPTGVGQTSVAHRRSRSSSLSSLQEKVRSVVQEVLVQVMGYEISHTEGFMASGLDSLGASEMVHLLSERLHLDLSETITFDYPTPGALIEFLTNEMYSMENRDTATYDRARAEAESSSAVSAALAQVLGTEIRLDQPLLEAGLDSLGATELVHILSERLSLDLPGTLVFDYPTGRALASHLVEEICHRDSILVESPSPKVSAWEMYDAATPHRGFLPILGFSEANMEGDERAKTAADLTNIDRIVHIPLSRWDVDYALQMANDEATQAIRFGAHMADIDVFDAQMFGLSSTEATAMDPQARILLQMSGDVLLSNPSVASVRSTGVFIGMTWTDYLQLASFAGLPISVYTAQGAVLGVTPGRISYHFALRGPSVALETACSSALVATNAGRQSILEQGGAALVGGINLLINPSTTYNTVKAGMLTADGRCKALDAAADGYVRSESSALMLLGENIDSLREGAAAILASTAVNQDGRSSALTAPNGPAQQDVLRLALLRIDALPSSIGGLALHGTGTSLGDPIEIGSACSVLYGRGASGTDHGINNGKVVIQASKSKIGHAEPASGITSLLYLRAVGCCNGVETNFLSLYSESRQVILMNNTT